VSDPKRRPPPCGIGHPLRICPCPRYGSFFNFAAANAPPSPRVRGEGRDEGARTGAQICSAQNRGEAPSPSLRSTSPRAAGRGGNDSRSRDASAPGFCPPPRHNNKALFDSPPKIEGRRSADRRIHPLSAPHIQMLPSACARARKRAERSALAYRRSTAALARPDASSIGSAPDPRFLRPGHVGCYPLRPVSSLPSTSETGRSAGRSGTQSRPGAVCETARGHRPRPTFRIASRKRPSMSEMKRHVT
jgi:hypothetical protein